MKENSNVFYIEELCNVYFCKIEYKNWKRNQDSYACMIWFKTERK